MQHTRRHGRARTAFGASATVIARDEEEGEFLDVALFSLVGLTLSLLLVCYGCSPQAVELMQQAWTF